MRNNFSLKIALVDDDPFMLKLLGRMLENLTRLRLKHFRLLIDDFGTGHSSFAQLRDLPVWIETWKARRLELYSA